MLQFNRKVEYALAIVAHLAGDQNEALHSARSVAEQTHIPFDMVTKCLQRLHRQGLCTAIQGKHGGYRLDANLEQLTIGAFLDQVFEPVAIAECLSKPGEASCALVGSCDLAVPMQRLNDRIIGLLHEITLAEFLSSERALPSEDASDHSAGSTAPA